MSNEEALAQFHATSKEAAAIWNAVWSEAGKAYGLAIQQDNSVQAMIVADRRHDKTMQKADAIMATTMRIAHEQLLEQLKECNE